MKIKIFLTILASFLLLLPYTTYAQCGMMGMGGGKTGTATVQKETAVSDTGKVMYTCPMHAEVKSDKPGNCPKCGMALVKNDGKSKGMGCGMMMNMGKSSGGDSTQQKTDKKVPSEKATYICSKCGGDYDKPGKCPKCNINLTEKK
ncbi:MAG TPA: heavy metal-binding domain-containing protein [Bacteroidia bacterium]